MKNRFQLINPDEILTEEKLPLITYFGGVCLQWNKWVKIDDNQANHIWNGRSEVVRASSCPAMRILRCNGQY